ncbi:hypothetical protein OAF87_04100 [Akkermansiaceae bacterium]|nr:hypothetical protein [Akkermansiaceae bacterium]
MFDTERREVLSLEPVDGKTYRFYCCGPTVYGPAHIGNFRTFVLQDVLRRALELGGLKTKHVRNITDVDDKTIRDSVAAGQTLEDFTAQWRDQFHADCEALNCLKPHIEPSAVKHIPEQITMIEELIENGNSYASDDGSVYFKISSYEGYGTPIVIASSTALAPPSRSELLMVSWLCAQRRRDSIRGSPPSQW